MISKQNLIDRKERLQESVKELLDGFYSLDQLAKELGTYPRRIAEIRDGKVTKASEVTKFLLKLGQK